MSTFKEANQAKISLKMPLSNYSWFKGMVVATDNDGFCVVVNVSKIDNKVKRLVPQVHQAVSVRLNEI
jgi:hypothetical protein